MVAFTLVLILIGFLLFLCVLGTAIWVGAKMGLWLGKKL